MDLWHSLSGMVEVELVCADPEKVLGRLNSEGIVTYSVKGSGVLSLRTNVKRCDLKRSKQIAQKYGGRLSCVNKRGLYWCYKSLLRRPVLLLGLILLSFLSVYLPSIVLFVQVEGNEAIPAAMIISAAADNGVGFGASRRAVRSEKLKNALLESIPELQWVGVNTYGCRAVISVREREVRQEGSPPGGVSSIVAARDGVIQEMTVIRGDPACQLGKSVKEGQVLISGYTDLGICIRGERAEGEIFALTQRSLEVLFPDEGTKRGTMIGCEKKYSLIIGKNRINFFKGSGISDTTCDKMYTQYDLTLPGGYRLPIAIAVEEYRRYDHASVTTQEAEAREILEHQTSAYLSQIMVAGEIQRRWESIHPVDGGYCLTGKYACYEMIGISRLEENLSNYEDDRTKR